MWSRNGFSLDMIKNKKEDVIKGCDTKLCLVVFIRLQPVHCLGEKHSFQNRKKEARTRIIPPGAVSSLRILGLDVDVKWTHVQTGSGMAQGQVQRAYAKNQFLLFFPTFLPGKEPEAPGVEFLKDE